MWRNLTYKTWVTPHKWHIMKAGNGRYFVLFPHLLNDNFNYFDFHTSQVESTHPFYHMLVLVHFMKKSKGETQIECQKWWLVASADQSSSRTAASWGFTCEEHVANKGTAGARIAHCRPTHLASPEPFQTLCECHGSTCSTQWCFPIFGVHHGLWESMTLKNHLQ